MFSLESPTIFNIKKENPLIYSNSAAMGVCSKGLKNEFEAVVVNEPYVFEPFKGSSQHQVGGEWFEIELGKISRMLVKYEVLPIPNVISVC